MSQLKFKGKAVVQLSSGEKHSVDVSMMNPLTSFAWVGDHDAVNAGNHLVGVIGCKVEEANIQLQAVANDAGEHTLLPPVTTHGMSVIEHDFDLEVIQ